MKRQAYFCIFGYIFGVLGMLQFIRAVLKLPVQVGILYYRYRSGWRGLAELFRFFSASGVYGWRVKSRGEIIIDYCENPFVR